MMITNDLFENKCKWGVILEQSILNHANITDEQFKELLRKMWQIRFFEEHIETLYQEGEIYGTMHLCIGQEASAVGSAGILNQDDWITSTHRNHGHCLAKGTDMRKMFAEMLGRVTGTNEGKGGSMHIADLDVGNLGSNGIVGAGFPIAAGAALTSQMHGTNQVVISYGGDGSTNEGSFHEALNMASIWNLPVVFFIENNQYGMSSSVKEMTNISELSQRAQAYGIPGVTIDGNDLVEVVNTTWDAIERARRGDGPTLIEAFTYRYRGHSKSDIERNYRPRMEEELWKEKLDPIERTEILLQRVGIMTQEEMEMEKELLQNQIQSMIASVKQDERPSEESLYTHVYAD